jgi:hypothetical protein
LPTVFTVSLTVPVTPPVTPLTFETTSLTTGGAPWSVGSVTVGSSGAALATPPEHATIAAAETAAQRV